MSIHSGKRLSDVPFDEIFVGMEVIDTVICMEGKVDRVWVRDDIVEDTKENWLSIKWQNRFNPYGPHHVFKKAKVK